MRCVFQIEKTLIYHLLLYMITLPDNKLHCSWYRLLIMYLLPVSDLWHPLRCLFGAVSLYVRLGAKIKLQSMNRNYKDVNFFYTLTGAKNLTGNSGRCQSVCILPCCPQKRCNQLSENTLGCVSIAVVTTTRGSDRISGLRCKQKLNSAAQKHVFSLFASSLLNPD